MNEEEIRIGMQIFKSKVGYCFNYKDLEEVEYIFERMATIQQENTQLKEVILVDTKKEVALQEQITKLQQQLKDKDEKISKLNSLVDMSGKFTGNFFDIGFKQNQKLEKIKLYLETTYSEWFNWKSDILEILESNKED